MPNIRLGPVFDSFVEKQVKEGRFRNASEVVRAGLRLLQAQELQLAERTARLKQSINAAFDEMSVDIPANDAFERLERQFETDSKARRRGP